MLNASWRIGGAEFGFEVRRRGGNARTEEKTIQTHFWGASYARNDKALNNRGFVGTE